VSAGQIFKSDENACLVMVNPWMLMSDSLEVAPVFVAGKRESTAKKGAVVPGGRGVLMGTSISSYSTLVLIRRRRSLKWA
jgi:hypothetical protein